jgi:hypothetical protein
MLWSHTRDIYVKIFKNKVVYNIPLYSDLVFKNFKIEYKNNSIILTTFQEPVQHHLEEPSCGNQIIGQEQPAENDKYSLSHQQAFHEMK